MIDRPGTTSRNTERHVANTVYDALYLATASGSIRYRKFAQIPVRTGPQTTPSNALPPKTSIEIPRCHVRSTASTRLPVHNEHIYKESYRTYYDINYSCVLTPISCILIMRSISTEKLLLPTSTMNIRNRQVMRRIICLVQHLRVIILSNRAPFHLVPRRNRLAICIAQRLHSNIISTHALFHLPPDIRSKEVV